MARWREDSREGMLMEVDWFRIGNYVEAAVWGAMAVGFAVYAVRLTGPVKRRWIAAAVLLALFGLSDVVEVQTGAWWRPWWLLVWKVLCVVGLVGLVVWYVVERRKTPGCASLRRGEGES